jgi:hypothetical protein
MFSHFILFTKGVEMILAAVLLQAYTINKYAILIDSVAVLSIRVIPSTLSLLDCLQV